MKSEKLLCSRSRWLDKMDVEFPVERNSCRSGSFVRGIVFGMRVTELVDRSSVYSRSPALATAAEIVIEVIVIERSGAGRGSVRRAVGQGGNCEGSRSPEVIETERGPYPRRRRPCDLKAPGQGGREARLLLPSIS